MQRSSKEDRWDVHLTKNDVKVLRQIIKDGRATDTKIAKEIIDRLHDINKKGTTVSMVTHNKDTTAGTRVLNLIDGQVV